MSSINLGPHLHDGENLGGRKIGKGEVVVFRKGQDIAFASYRLRLEQEA